MRLSTICMPAALLLAGCLGLIGDGDGESDAIDSDEQGIVCNDSAGPSVSPMRRIGERAYVNTLRDVMARMLSPAAAEEIVDALAQPLSLLPRDNGSGQSAHQDYDRLDQGSAQAHVDAYYEIAVAAARQLTATPARLTELAGACATDGDSSNDALCVQEFVARLAFLALRRPPSSDELAFYAADATGSVDDVSAEAFAERIAVLLQAPQFLYHIEDAQPATAEDDALYPLSGYELASRLSYHFWDTMPDEELFAAAERGDLETAEGYAAAVERLFADPRTAETLDHYFRAWLWLDELPALDAALGTAAYDDFAGANAPGPELTQRVAEEALDLLRHYTWTEPGDLSDVLTSNLSFAKTEDLAAIYGVPPWQEGEPPPELPAGERAGLLTRAAMLVTGTVRTRPIMKGLWILERLLCNQVPPPPPDAELTKLADVPADATVRERLELLTMKAGSECVGCHQVINPYGFATESYDALGRHRTEERVYDDEGVLIATVPIDASSSHGDGGVALSESMASTVETKACMAKNYFRFAFGRHEDPEADACELEALTDALDAGSLADMFRTVASTRAFRQRRRGDD